MDFILDLLQGAGLAAAIGIRPFLPVLLAGALASADAGLDFRGTDFSFLEEWPFLLGVLVARRGAGRRRPPRRPRRRRPAAAALHPRGRRARAGGAARGRIGRRPLERLVGRAIVGVACAALGFQAARSLFARVRRRLDDAGGERAARLRRGRRGRRRGRVDPVPAARAARDRRASSGYSSADAAGPARSTPGCACCARAPWRIARSSSSRSSTR